MLPHSFSFNSVARVGALTQVVPVAVNPVFNVANTSGSTGASITLAGSLSNGYIIFIAHYIASGGGPWDAYFNGSPMTKLGTQSFGGRTFDVWGLPVGNLAIGTYSATRTGTSTTASGMILVYSGVNQSTPTGAVVGGTSFSTSRSLTPVSAVGDLAVFLAGYATGTPTLGGAQTQNAALVATYFINASSAPGLATSTPLSISYSANQNNSAVAFALKAV